MLKRDPERERSGPRKHQKPGVHLISGSKRGPQHRGGFTLTEILVAISIIGLILGILAAASLAVMKEARSEQVRSMMTAMLAANDEFKAVRQQGPVNHDSPPNTPINWSQESAGNSSIRRFVYAIKQVPSAEQIMIAAIKSSSEEAFERMYDGNTVKDRWGTELRYRRSNDGTGSFNGEDNDELPLSRSPFLVSAGPDKAFGTDDDITSIENPTYLNN